MSTKWRDHDHKVIARSVFISHTSQDKPIVRRIADLLKREGCDVWLDEQQLYVRDDSGHASMGRSEIVTMLQ
jgi:hypothetical protein